MRIIVTGGFGFIGSSLLNAAIISLITYYFVGPQYLKPILLHVAVISVFITTFKASPNH